MNPDEQGSSGLAQADEGLAAQSGGLDSGLSPKINRDPPPRGPLIPKRKLRLLMLEDQSSDADLILRELQRAGFDLDSHRVETEPDFVARLDPSLDLILADFRLPGGFNGMQALRLVQQRGLDIPFIVISATVRDELGVECIKQGASEFVLKGRFIRAHLGRAVSRALEEKRTRDERKKAEEAHQRLAAIVEGSDDAIFSSSLRGLITSWNPGAHHLFGYTAGEAIGRPLSMLIPAEHAEEGPECLASIARGDRVRSFHTVRLRKEGQLVQVSVTISPIMDVQGQVVGASEIAREITDTKPAVAKLSEGEARFQQLADHLPAVFWVIDASNQRVVFVNSAYDSVWGQPRQSLQANPLAWLEAVNQVDRPRVHEALKKKRPAGNYDETYCITRPDGAQRWIRDRAYPVRNKAGKIERFVGMAEDITEQREIEEQLRQIQKMEAVSHLAGGLARDLNNIFAVMHAYTAILLAQKGIDADTTEQLRQMARVADRATVLPSQLLTFSHKQILRPTSVDLNQIVATTAKKLQETIAADICLRLECPPNLPHLRADAAMIEQALMNLGLNARDAMPRGGQITISTSISTLDDSALGAHPQGRPGTFVTLKVADSGSGMSPEVMAHLFEPFFTTKRSGEDVGLGLATVLSIIQQHRGWVEAQSVAGQGASFTIFLPCGDPDPGAVATDDGRAEVLGGTETILIVEDDARVRRVALKALERFGYRVLSASSGVAALSLWNSQAEGIDVLVTDLVRPYGMSGAELAAKLRVFKPDLKIIFTSGYAVDEVDLDVELKAGVTLLLKPYGPEKLAKVVRQSLDS